MVEHFDHYINGWKMGDANAELNDPILQRQLLSKQSVDGRGGDDDHPTSKM